ncbi:uncharacterized protein AB675_2975 [Cyphellophora attinorum]|uniref:Uncharacterized protein n=1 Tax=Cyphellophora attinorum TaxID=1664694 RepID=A0A0N1HJB5_9EURO|nr:uncharacterized protein AB675_2975 [Phialophora attinorum]KPI36485.1 hypothetical protein AB675_2975 [Phialophora attinorum]
MRTVNLLATLLTTLTFLATSVGALYTISKGAYADATSPSTISTPSTTSSTSSTFSLPPGVTMPLPAWPPSANNPPPAHPSTTKTICSPDPTAGAFIAPVFPPWSTPTTTLNFVTTSCWTLVE